MRTTSPRWAALALFTLGIALGPEALAQPAESASRKAARVLAEEGLSLFDQKDYVGALERFNKADSLMDAPTVDVFAARCLVQLGRLVEAAARYQDAINAPLPDDSPQPLKAAQADAKQERAALMPRLPALSLAVEGGADGATLAIDGKAIDPATLREPIPVDPGSHRVEGKRADATVTEQVTLAEGEKKSITLKLPKLPPPPKTIHQPESPGAWMRTAGLIGLGAGGAGLIVWGITGGIALGQRPTLEENGCSNERCPAWSRPGSYSGLRVASMVGLYSGIGLAGIGATLFLLAPSPSKTTPNAARIEPWIGVASGGVRGAF
jgi:hypothetical protein